MSDILGTTRSQTQFLRSFRFLKTIHPEIKLGEALDYYQRQCLPNDGEQLTN